MKYTNAWNSVFKCGVEEALRTTRANLNRAIGLAKHTHSPKKKKIKDFLHDATNTRIMWQNIRAITNDRIAPPLSDDNADYLNELNNFFGRFEALNSSSADKAVPYQDERALYLDTVDVRETLRRVNIRKAPSLDNIPGRVLRECADQLAYVLKAILTPQWIKPNSLHISRLPPSPQCSKTLRSHHLTTTRPLHLLPL